MWYCGNCKDKTGFPSVIGDIVGYMSYRAKCNMCDSPGGFAYLINFPHPYLVSDDSSSPEKVDRNTK